MTLGIWGSGPYGKIRSLRSEISQCKYEIRMIGMGMKIPLKKEELEKKIVSNRLAIKKILGLQKRKKK